MNKSDNITELAKALCIAQTELEGAIKDSKNPYFKSDYADLSSVWDAIRIPFTKNGLSVSQLTDIDHEGVIIETILMHISGEWIAGRLFMRPTKNDPQGIGSAITYGRRYGLQAIAGVCPKDDDGNKASGHIEDTTLVLTLTEAQAENVRKLLTEADADLAKMLAWLKVNSIAEIPAARYEQVMTQLTVKKAEAAAKAKAEAEAKKAAAKKEVGK